MMIKREVIKDEFIYQETLKNGLKLYLHPKNKFVQTYASLQVNFGGRDFSYQIDGRDYTLPEGTAHFLEHMLFENNGNNLSDFFVESSADINAYTSRTLTSYYFSTRNNFLALLSRLIDNFVDYNFPKESIKKELNIISQELAMNDDSYSVKAFKSLQKLMYKDSSVYVETGGSKKSIKNINQEVLKQATEHFYHPGNMYLVITGNFDVDEVLSMLKNHPFSKKKWPEHKDIKRTLDMSDKTNKMLIKKDKSLDTNIIEIGIKIPEAVFNNKDLEHGLLVNPFFSMINSPASGLYKALKKRNLTNYSFQSSPIYDDDHGFFNISVETKKPKLFVKTIKELLLEVPKLQFSEKVFSSYKKADIGKAIRSFDGIKLAHYQIKRLLEDDLDIYNFVEKAKLVTYDDFKPYLDIFTKENIYIVQYLKDA